MGCRCPMVMIQDPMSQSEERKINPRGRIMGFDSIPNGTNQVVTTGSSRGHHFGIGDVQFVGTVYVDAPKIRVDVV